MTAFHDVQFPPYISRNAKSGPKRQTDVVTLRSGAEERNAVWANSRRKYNAGYAIKGVAEAQAILAFWEERRGRLYGAEPEAPPPYTPDWSETGTAEHMLEAARRHLVEVDPAVAEAGDVLLFRMARGAIINHCAILAGEGRMIHAVSRDRVREVLSMLGGGVGSRRPSCFQSEETDVER